MAGLKFTTLHRFLLPVALTVALAGCAGRSAPDVININGLIPVTDTKRPNVRAYEIPTFDHSRYNGLLIDAADVYSGSDAGFGDVSVADRERLAAMLTSEFKRVLTPDFRLVSTPAPGVVRVHLTLVGVNESHPVLSTALRLTPAGLALSAVRGVESKSALFTGSISMAGRLRLPVGCRAGCRAGNRQSVGREPDLRSHPDARCRAQHHPGGRGLP